MTVLIVVAHPDDEVLGCGGLAYQLSLRGQKVYTCILCADAAARRLRPDIAELRIDMLEAHAILGINHPIIGRYPNLQLNCVPHVDLVRFIEGAIQQTGASTIITHHPSDLNNDHVQTSLACQAAARIYQRTSHVTQLKSLLFMEVASATDWSFAPSADRFSPNCFFEIGDVALDRKVAALFAYRDVARPFPHPRSEEVLRGLAAYRGGQSGLVYAEAFQAAFINITTAT